MMASINWATYVRPGDTIEGNITGDGAGVNTGDQNYVVYLRRTIEASEGDVVSERVKTGHWEAR